MSGERRGVVGDGSPTGAKPCPSNVPHDRHEWIDGVKRRDCPGVREPRVASSSGTGHDAATEGADRFPETPGNVTTYAVKVYFGATPDEFDVLHDKVLDAITDALGCTDDEDFCPHFQVGIAGPRRYEGRRFWALRCALRGLWEAVRYGEV